MGTTYNTNRVKSLGVMSRFHVLLFAVVVLTATGASAASTSEEAGKKELSALKVKVISLKDCGAPAPTINLIKKTASALNIQIELLHVIVKTSEEAIQHRYLGSPTVQINGLDIEPKVRTRQQFGLT